MNRLMNSGLMRLSSSKAYTLIGQKVGASLAGASALGGEEGYVTFDVIKILENQQNYFAESFEAGMTLLREHYQVNAFSQ